MTPSPSSLTDRLLHWAGRCLDPNPPSAASGRVPGWPGLYLGTGTAGPVWGGPEHHGLIIGPPRSGKTTRLVIPNINLHPGAVVATTTKTDLTAATVGVRARVGTCWWWDPTGTVPAPAGTTTLRWSPVVGCHTWDGSVARAHALAVAARPSPSAGLSNNSETHWIERAQALLAPLLHAAALREGDMASVLSWLHRHDLADPLDILTRNGSVVAAELLTGIGATEARERSGIFSTADSLLAPYRTDAALAASRHPNFDPRGFATSTDTVYLCAPGASQAQVAPLIICLLDQIRSAVYATRRYPSMLWALDELANIAPLPDLPATISEGASQGLIVLASLQDLSQARARWGTVADGFATLFTHKLILPGIADLATLRQISALAGDIYVPVDGRSRDNALFARSSTSTTIQRRPRLPVEAIATGRPGYAIWLNRTQPIVVGLSHKRCNWSS